jgi:hypothetical protein
VSAGPTTPSREDYRTGIREGLYRLAGLVEADFDPHDQAVVLARSLHYEVREYFNSQRWKATPVYDGICARVPLEVPVTLLIIHHREHARGREWVQGKLQAIHSPHRPNDGAEFVMVPRRCRRSRTYHYRAWVGAELSVYPGFVDESGDDGPRHPTPLYQHAAMPPIQDQQADSG